MEREGPRLRLFAGRGDRVAAGGASRASLSSACFSLTTTCYKLCQLSPPYSSSLLHNLLFSHPSLALSSPYSRQRPCSSSVAPTQISKSAYLLQHNPHVKAHPKLLNMKQRAEDLVRTTLPPSSPLLGSTNPGVNPLVVFLLLCSSLIAGSHSIPRLGTPRTLDCCGCQDAILKTGRLWDTRA